MLLSEEGREYVRKHDLTTSGIYVQGITDKKLKGQLKATEKLYGEATLNAAQVEQVSLKVLPLIL
jgi:hypothetical protein